MGTISRWMPKARPHKVIRTSIFLVAILGVVLFFWGFSLKAFPIALGLILLIAYNGFMAHNRLLHFAEARIGDGICTFARSFDRRTVDPWIVRSVYEEFFAYFNGRLPICAAYRIEDDLDMDLEEIEFMIGDIAFRAGRTLKNAEANPLFDRIRTVGDLVLFLEHQPKRGVA